LLQETANFKWKRNRETFRREVQLKKSGGELKPSGEENQEQKKIKNEKFGKLRSWRRTLP